MSTASAAARASDRNATSEVLVARQPIFDGDLKLHGYELLYRSIERHAANVQDDDEATHDVITTAFIDIGLDRLVGGQLAFVNVSRDFIVGGDIEALPADRLVFEILEDVAVDRELVASITALVARGYRFALDNFRYATRWEPVLELAHMVKLDFRSATADELREQAARLARHQLFLLGQRLESDDDYTLAKEIGCTHFQGFFFARPRIVAGKRLQGNKLATLRLLTALHNPEVELQDVAALVSQDATLSYKVLRFINSAAVAIPREMESIRQAVVYLGLQNIRRMVTLTTVASVDDKPGELIRIALIRARLCELPCARAGVAAPGSAFTVGLFSALDALMDRPLSELLEELPLASEVSTALLDGEGMLGEALQCAFSYEQGDWLGVQFQSLSPPEVGDAYTEAVEWADQVASGL